MSPLFFMKFIWTKTGDYLTVDVTHLPLVEHWLEQLPSNKFKIKEDDFPYKSINRLQDSLAKVNELFKTKFNITTFDYDEVRLDQNFLNQVHRDWAQVHDDNPALPRLLDKMGNEWLDLFYDINLAFHKIESSCKIRYIEQSSETKFKHQLASLDNICDYLSHGISHLSLQYWSLGRDEYDAWLHSDEVAKITNFDRLPYTLDCLLKRPYNNEYPKDYIQWMKKQGKNPIGSYIPIGNFKDYKDSVGDLYEIFVKNNKVDQNIELIL